MGILCSDRNVKGSGFVRLHLKKNVRKKQFVGRIFGFIIATIAQFRCCYAKSAIDNTETIDTMLINFTDKTHCIPDLTCNPETATTTL